MKRLILLLSATALMFVLSCTAATKGSVDADDYYRGREYGEVLAKGEIIKASCFENNRNPDGFFTQGAHVENLGKAGKSATFIKGFRWGYRATYKDLVPLYCGERADNTIEYER